MEKMFRDRICIDQYSILGTYITQMPPKGQFWPAPLKMRYVENVSIAINSDQYSTFGGYIYHAIASNHPVLASGAELQPLKTRYGKNACDSVYSD
jgi:hypothetical protein